MTQLFQQLNSNSPLPQQIQPNLLQMFLQSSNPKGFLEQMVASQPKLKPIWQALTNSNLTPKEFFYQYAQQNNINPDQFFQSLQQK